MEELGFVIGGLCIAFLFFLLIFYCVCSIEDDRTKERFKSYVKQFEEEKFLGKESDVFSEIDTTLDTLEKVKDRISLKELALVKVFCDWLKTAVCQLEVITDTMSVEDLSIFIKNLRIIDSKNLIEIYFRYVHNIRRFGVEFCIKKEVEDSLIQAYEIIAKVYQKYDYEYHRKQLIDKYLGDGCSIDKAIYLSEQKIQYEKMEEQNKQLTDAINSIKIAQDKVSNAVNFIALQHIMNGH